MASGIETGSIAGRAASGDLFLPVSGTGDANRVLRLDGIEFAAAIAAGEFDLCGGRVAVEVVIGCEPAAEFDAGGTVVPEAAGGTTGGCVGSGDGTAEPGFAELLGGCDPSDDGGAAAGSDVFACTGVPALCPLDGGAASAGTVVPSAF